MDNYGQTISIDTTLTDTGKHTSQSIHLRIQWELNSPEKIPRCSCV